MSLGMLATIAEQAPANFYHFLLDNECYATTGGQPVPNAKNVAYDVLARGAGYPRAFAFTELDGLQPRTAGILARARAGVRRAEGAAGGREHADRHGARAGRRARATRWCRTCAVSSASGNRERVSARLADEAALYRCQAVERRLRQWTLVHRRQRLLELLPASPSRPGWCPSPGCVMAKRTAASARLPACPCCTSGSSRRARCRSAS